METCIMVRGQDEGSTTTASSAHTAHSTVPLLCSEPTPPSDPNGSNHAGFGLNCLAWLASKGANKLETHLASLILIRPILGLFSSRLSSSSSLHFQLTVKFLPPCANYTPNMKFTSSTRETGETENWKYPRYLRGIECPMTPPSTMVFYFPNMTASRHARHGMAWMACWHAGISTFLD